MLREPLVHFLLAGALIFAAYGLFGRDDSSARRIEVTPAAIERLQQVFTAQWRRPPSSDELKGLIDQDIQEEVLYREAKALGLDEDDTIVRRRLAQKMQFMIEDTAPPATPTEGDLARYFEDHKADFRTSPYLSFSHIYFSTDRRPDAEQAAARLLAELGTVERAQERGDPFMLRSDYAEVSRADVARLFGAEFADRLFELPTGAWQGPVRSGYGFHVVRIANKTIPPEPELGTVRDKVNAAWLDDARRRGNAAALARIRSQYEIVIDDAASADAR